MGYIREVAEDQEQPGQGAGPGGMGEEQPSQEELRARLEEELAKVRVQDLLLESVSSVLNLAARRIAKEDERDLEQGRIGIEAVRAMLELLDPEPREQVRSALSQVQMLYARQAQGGEGEAEARGEAAPPHERGGAAESRAPKRDSGLWTPPGTD